MFDSNLTQPAIAADELTQRYQAGERNFNGIELPAVHLEQINLRGADLSYTDLSNANLSRADLRGTDLSYANLSGANLQGADLRGASLMGANLTLANLAGTQLEQADYDAATRFDEDFSPQKVGMNQQAWTATTNPFAEAPHPHNH